MSKKSLLIFTMAATLCAVLPASAQRSAEPDPSQPGGYPLPDGSAKKLVQDNCTICHNLRNLVTSNKSPEDWDNTVDMMKNAGAPITADQAKEIKQYLIA